MTPLTHVIVFASIIAIATVGCGTEHEDNRTHAPAVPAADSSTDTAGDGDVTMSFAESLHFDWDLVPKINWDPLLNPHECTKECTVSCLLPPNTIFASSVWTVRSYDMKRACEAALSWCLETAWKKLLNKYNDLGLEAVEGCITPQAEEYKG